MLVNFYADWCRFSQMLKPIYAAAARQMASMPNVRLGSVNCEADDTVRCTLRACNPATPSAFGRIDDPDGGTTSARYRRPLVSV